MIILIYSIQSNTNEKQASKQPERINEQWTIDDWKSVFGNQLPD
jgi:hypothetical protein